MTFMLFTLFPTAFFVFISCATGIKDTDNLSVAPLPAECQSAGFCSVKPENYDELEKKINKILPEVFVKDYTDRYGEEDRMQPPKLSPEEDWDNCPSETKTELIYTFKAEGNNSKTEIIVQTSLFKQYLQTVVCASRHIPVDSEEQCFKNLFASGLSTFNLKSTCQTVTTRRTLYVYDIERNEIIQKMFHVPACCRCNVAFKFS